MKPLVALIDADNFYVSCERLFHPGLAGRPVVVLSNNDGCVVARSQEVKDMGVKMGTPFYQIEGLAGQRGIAVFSSNYELYGDMSARMMSVFADFSSVVEVYSIDEAFLELSPEAVERTCEAIVARCRDWLGLPVKIGVSHSKTLAKLATEGVKRQGLHPRYCVLRGRAEIAAALDQVELEDIWGVGGRLADRLRASGIVTPRELVDVPESRLRKRFGVVLSRTVAELNGVTCFALDDQTQPRKSMCCSRSFGQSVSDFEGLRAAVSAYAGEVAAKLRRHRRKARSLCVFVATNRFKANGPHYAHSVCLPLALPTNDTLALVRRAVEALSRVFRPGFEYKKAGVVVAELIPESVEQADLFIERDGRDAALSQAIDAITARYGSGAIVVGYAGRQPQKWQTAHRRRSSRYTTRWEELLSVA